MKIFNKVIFFYVLFYFYGISSVQAENNKCVEQISNMQNKLFLKAEYEIKWRGKYAFFFGYELKSHIERRLREGSNKFKFYDVINNK